MTNRFFAIILSLLLPLILVAQDTLTVMHYNLLYYGHNTGFCNSTNNNLTVKNEGLRLILGQVKPDIFTVNEIARSEYIHQQLMDETLNTGGIGHYQKAGFYPVSNSNIMNMIYFDSRKLRLKGQYVAQTLVRDIDVYELYYNSTDLVHGDTTFIICVVAHLKASNSASDRETRRVQVLNTMEYLEDRYAQSNVMFMGDFNFYTAYEPGFQLMINYPNTDMRFYDPVGQIGDWHVNPFYAIHHTQSTHTSATSGCHAGGGMDDRFDFIMISDEIRFGTDNALYVPGSYHAFGQDGQRFNGSIIGPPANTAVSQQIAEALFTVSDHLPVVLKLRVDKVLAVVDYTLDPFLFELGPNPAAGQVNARFYLQKPSMVNLQLFDLQGRLLKSERHQLQSGSNSLKMNLAGLSQGMYFISLSDESGVSVSKRLAVAN